MNLLPERNLVLGQLSLLSRHLKAKLDQHPDLFPAADTAPATALRTHQNLRGAEYFREPTSDQQTSITDEGDDNQCLSNPRSIH